MPVNDSWTGQSIENLQRLTTLMYFDLFIICFAQCSRGRSTSPEVFKSSRTAAVADSGEPDRSGSASSPQRRIHSSHIGRHSDARIDDKLVRDRPPSQERIQYIIDVSL